MSYEELSGTAFFCFLIDSIIENKDNFFTDDVVSRCNSLTPIRIILPNLKILETKFPGHNFEIILNVDVFNDGRSIAIIIKEGSSASESYSFCFCSTSENTKDSMCEELKKIKHI